MLDASPGFEIREGCDPATVRLAELSPELQARIAAEQAQASSTPFAQLLDRLGDAGKAFSFALEEIELAIYKGEAGYNEGDCGRLARACMAGAFAAAHLRGTYVNYCANKGATSANKDDDDIPF